MENQKLVHWILRVTVATLATICLSVVIILLIGLFDNQIDNTKIFEVLAPAFNTVIGAFVGLLGGLSLNKSAGKE